MAFKNIDEAKKAASKIRSDKDIRNFARQAIEILNITSFDINTSNANKIRKEDVQSWHDWDGAISFSKEKYKEIKQSLSNFSKGNVSVSDAYNLVELMHEELHGCSPCFYTALCRPEPSERKWVLRKGLSYLEEISTELLSRIVVTYLGIVNKETSIPLYKKGWKYSKHEYLTDACDLANWLSDLCGYDKTEAMNNIINASITMRRYRYKTYTPKEYVLLFGNYLGLNKKQLEKFVERHITWE